MNWMLLRAGVNYTWNIVRGMLDLNSIILQSEFNYTWNTNSGNSNTKWIIFRGGVNYVFCLSGFGFEWRLLPILLSFAAIKFIYHANHHPPNPLPPRTGETETRNPILPRWAQPLENGEKHPPFIREFVAAFGRQFEFISITPCILDKSF